MNSKLMIEVLQFGCGCGLTNRFEMIRAYCYAHPRRFALVMKAATEFEKRCCYSIEQEIGKLSLTPEELAYYVFPEFQWIYDKINWTIHEEAVCPTPTTTQ